MSRARASVLLLIALTFVVALMSASAGSGAGGDVGWGGFGNTPDNNRHSSLAIINAGNIDQLGRIVQLPMRTLDPIARLGMQSVPVIVGDKMYVTTNESDTYELDATTGQKIWRWAPNNVAVFNKAGIVANRGVAVCDGKVYVLTIDMTIVELNQRTGDLIARVPISRAVNGAASRYGYSETSAPICANHHIIVGAAGSEYGVRGFVMAYNTTGLTPAWPGPFWTIPPEGKSWRSKSRVVGGGVVWTPTTVDTTTNTLYFGTGSGTPLYYPALRPGSNPRADSLVAVDLLTGRLKWWQQQMSHNEWAYDTAQPPLVYTGKVGGKRRRVVSVATMEGVWFCYDAATGAPIYQRVKVIDRVEHPSLQPGKPVVVYPSALGGLNFSPASFDPATNYIFNGAAETAAIDIQTQLSPTQKARKRLHGDVFLGLQNGDFGQYLPGWHDSGSISAIDVNTGKRVWKFKTPEPERGGITTTAAGIGFAGGGDGNLRAFDLKTGTVLWTFQTGKQIAGGVAVYSVDGKQYIAVTIGGTPTSSNGGVIPELQIFALGGSQKQSPPPNNLPAFRAPQSGNAVPQTFEFTPATTHLRAKHARRVAASGLGHITTTTGLVVKPWNPNSSNWENVFGHVYLGSKPVAGAHIRVDGYGLPGTTGANGGFFYPIDITVPARHAIRVVGTATARVDGRKLTSGEQAALRATTAGFSVGYGLRDLTAKVQGNGTVLVSGRLSDTAGTPPPSVNLYTYRLSGTITDVSGAPVAGAVVVTRTNDRSFWTFSGPTDANGRYVSFFHASDETAADPVPLSVGVALGAISYGGNVGTMTTFKRDQSAVLDIKLGKGTAYTLGTPSAIPDAVYEGLVAGVTGAKGVIKPLSARWPDSSGKFSFVLPASAKGQTLHFWESLQQTFSATPGVPGGAIQLTTWPTHLGGSTPNALATLTVPS